MIYNEDDDVVDPQAIHAYAISVHAQLIMHSWRPLLSWRAYSFEGGDFISLSQAGHFMTRIPASNIYDGLVEVGQISLNGINEQFSHYSIS